MRCRENRQGLPLPLETARGHPPPSKPPGATPGTEIAGGYGFPLTPSSTTLLDRSVMKKTPKRYLGVRELPREVNPYLQRPDSIRYAEHKEIMANVQRWLDERENSYES